MTDERKSSSESSGLCLRDDGVISFKESYFNAMPYLRGITRLW